LIVLELILNSFFLEHHSNGNVKQASSNRFF
jgi:hypothetical protein